VFLQLELAHTMWAILAEGIFFLQDDMYWSGVLWMQVEREDFAGWGTLFFFSGWSFILLLRDSLGLLDGLGH
jgi:hypothetical protein